MKIRHIVITASLFLILIISFFVMRDWAFNKMVNALLSAEVEVINSSEVNFDNTVVIDAREKKEYEVSHLPNAIWVGYDDFKIERVPLDKETNILIYCSIGKRSNDIALNLQEEGYKNVKNLHGGIFSWVNEGHEIVNDLGKTNKVHTYSMSWSIWLNKGEKVY